MDLAPDAGAPRPDSPTHAYPGPFMPTFMPALLRRHGPALLLWLLLLAAPWPLRAQQGPAMACPPAAPAITPERLAQAGRDARDHGPLWRVEKDGRRSWLYGTLHVARMAWAVPGPGVQQALQASDLLALELDPLDAESLKPLTEPADPAIARRVIGTDSERARRLALQLAQACLPPQALDTLRPVMRGAALVMLSGRAQGLYAEFAVDGTLAVLARRLGKPVLALEDAAMQAALLAGRDDAEEGELLDSALDELEARDSADLLLRLAQAWADGDMAMLEDYPRWCRCLDTPADREQMKRLLDDRNGPMADKIVALHEGGRQVFAAVGALHMIGPRGLPALLRARGLRVERQR
jgi:uncharacterized protein YbaP (TraB family)